MDGDLEKGSSFLQVQIVKAKIIFIYKTRVVGDLEKGCTLLQVQIAKAKTIFIYKTRVVGHDLEKRCTLLQDQIAIAKFITSTKLEWLVTTWRRDDPSPPPAPHSSSPHWTATCDAFSLQVTAERVNCKFLQEIQCYISPPPPQRGRQAPLTTEKE